ncbi:MAG TPA: hypothetical protein VHL14_09780, partial [Steroidobacteraceae bacterium]|nr:hypothetical protein [Steroidobacteraceae bacterium]
MRLAVLSEMADEWAARVSEWKLLLSYPTAAANDVYRLFQLLVSSWPLEFSDTESRNTGMAQYIDRLKTVMRKCMREAKQQSSWTAPNDEYEQQVLACIDALLASVQSAAFLKSFCAFHAPIAAAAAKKSLTQTALRLCMPGMPDTYQGTELWDFNMVDPDNRRAIDFRKREQLLHVTVNELKEDSEQAMRRYINNWQDGRIKLAVIYQLLDLRRTHATLFIEGNYVPLNLEGEQSHAIICFARHHNDQTMIVLARRFFAGRSAVMEWKDTRVVLPQAMHGLDWYEILSGQEFHSNEFIHVQPYLDNLPVAVMLRK